MWNNIATKRNPRQPDFKCKDKQCDGVIWPPREGRGTQPAPRTTPQPESRPVATSGKEPYAAGPYIEAIDGPKAAPPGSTVSRLDKLFGLYTACFEHAATLAHDKLGADCTHEAIAAQTATLFIAATEKAIAW